MFRGTSGQGGILLRRSRSQTGRRPAFRAQAHAKHASYLLWTAIAAADTISPMNVKAVAKATVRRAVRRLGFDVVPLAAGMPKLQPELLAHTPVAIDVGANVGQYAERLRDIGFAGRIVSFGPGLQAFRTLNRKAAGDAQWDARRYALGAQSGREILHVSANSVSSSLLDVADEHLRAAPRSRVVTRQEVEVSTLDEQLREELRGPL